MAAVSARELALATTRSEPLDYHCSLTRLGVCPIEACPDELLLTVARYLEDISLAKLALAAKRYCVIAQDILYRQVHLVPPGSPDTWERSKAIEASRSRLSQLLWTLTRRPSLARKVTSLAIYPYSDFYVIYCFDQLAGYAGSATELKKRVLEFPLAGLLLKLLPELRQLFFNQSYGDSLSDRYFRGDAPHGLLSQLELHSSKPELVAGLAKLERLHLGVSVIDGPLLSLPALQHVSFTNWIHIDPAYVEAPTSNITSVTIYCEINGWTDSQLSQRSFLQSLIKLRSVELIVTEKMPYDARDRRVSIIWDTYITRLNDVAGRLHRLELAHSKRLYSSRLWDNPARGWLAGFCQLRTLRIVFDALMANYHEPKLIAQRLPPRIETLCIIWPSKEVIQWLQTLAAHRDLVPSLTRVEVLGPAKHGLWGESNEDLTGAWKENRHLVNTFEEVGITLVIDEIWDR